LADAGFVEGQTVTIEYRWANGDCDKLPALAADLVNRKVAVFVGVGGDVSAAVAARATKTIPVVFGMGSEMKWYRNGSACCASSCLGFH
jgi:putative ABC transport system substrate-binding protein